MDLSQLDNWTRDALEAEARRIGIKGCEYRSRTELARLILRDRYGTTWDAGRQTLARGVQSLTDARSALGAAIERTIASVLSLPEPLASARYAFRDVHTAPTVPGTLAAPAGRETANEHEEPRRADTAAELTAPPVPAVGEAPRAASEGEPLAVVDDAIAWTPADASAARLRWQTSPEGIRRARAVLQADGELVVRVVIVAPDATRVVRIAVTDHGPVDADGEIPAPAAAEGARQVAAIGVRSGERFVSIAHARA